MALASLGLPRVGAGLAASALVAVAAGLTVGGLVSRRVDENVAWRVTLALAALGGALVVVQAAR